MLKALLDEEIISEDGEVSLDEVSDQEVDEVEDNSQNSNS
jgi:hypothetical protein